MLDIDASVEAMAASIGAYAHFRFILFFVTQYDHCESLILCLPKPCKTGTSPSALPTEAGVALASDIEATRTAYGLTKVLGCTNTSFFGADLTRLFFDTVVPEHLFHPSRNTSQWFVASTGCLRYPVFQGNITVDDVFKVMPFEDTFLVSRQLSGASLQAALAWLNNNSQTAEVRGFARPLWRLDGMGDYLSSNSTLAPNDMSVARPLH